jgi:hypothetical protein
MQMVLVISLPLVALVVIIAVILCIICRWSRARSVLRYGLGFFSMAVVGACSLICNHIVILAFVCVCLHYPRLWIVV